AVWRPDKTDTRPGRENITVFAPILGQKSKARTKTLLPWVQAHNEKRFAGRFLEVFFSAPESREKAFGLKGEGKFFFGFGFERKDSSFSPMGHAFLASSYPLVNRTGERADQKRF